MSQVRSAGQFLAYEVENNSLKCFLLGLRISPNERLRLNILVYEMLLIFSADSDLFFESLSESSRIFGFL